MYPSDYISSRSYLNVFWVYEPWRKFKFLGELIESVLLFLMNDSSLFELRNILLFVFDKC